MLLLLLLLLLVLAAERLLSAVLQPTSQPLRAAAAPSFAPEAAPAAPAEDFSSLLSSLGLPVSPQPPPALSHSALSGSGGDLAAGRNALLAALSCPLTGVSGQCMAPWLLLRL